MKKETIFKYEIGDNIKDNDRDLTIIDKKNIKNNKGYNEKFYKYKCKKCGFSCGKHYKYGELNEEYWISEYYLSKGNTCASCCTPSRIVVPEINSITAKEETHWMIPYFQGGYSEAKLYTPQSNKRVKFICPDCGKIKDKEIIISSLYKNHSIGCICGDGISYPEKLVFIMLESIVKSFETQKTFNWSKKIENKNFKLCGDKRYDFYFIHNNEEYIIEAHGEQHYINRGLFKGKTLEEEIENDRIKKELAIQNGIKEKNYIIIDCSKSELEWIKNSVLNSKLNELFDLNNLNWDSYHMFSITSRIKEASVLKKNNNNLSTKEIGEILKLDSTTIIKYLKIGTDLGWCNYDAKEEILKSTKRMHKAKQKPIEIFKDDISLGIYESAIIIENISMEKFGVKLDHSCIAGVCNRKNNRKQHKGYQFKYA